MSLAVTHLIGFGARRSASGPSTWTFTYISGPYSGFPVPTQALLSDGGTAIGSSFAAGTNTGSQHLRADFGSTVTVANVYLRDTQASGWGSSYTNGAYIEYSIDGSSWTLLATASGHSAGNLVTYPAGISARFVRLRGDPGTPNNWCACGDFYFN